MQQKTERLFFYFEVIWFELVALDSRFYWDRILFIGCEYVNKQSQDFRYYENILSGAHFILEYLEKYEKNSAMLI